jgi:hypothetical protein
MKKIPKEMMSLVITVGIIGTIGGFAASKTAFPA